MLVLEYVVRGKIGRLALQLKNDNWSTNKNDIPAGDMVCYSWRMSFQHTLYEYVYNARRYLTEGLG
jgi:hypothetical protein